MADVRLRQAVLVAADLDAVSERLRAELGLGEPFADPGVAEFGLRNHVFALGDQFLEIVSPVQTGTAAGRHLERHGGDGGYMVIFQLADLAGARERVERMGIRVVWKIDLPDISGTHLHPADVRGAIVSLDRPDPPGSWRWGGPDWESRAAPGRLLGVTISVREPEAVAARWGEVLGAPAAEAGVTFAADEADAGLTEIAVAVPGRREAVEIGGVRFRFEEDS
ncbi:MAG TPA: VOC family protein [Solirubrobacteraceae bacterium]|jgi:hypothetical protein